MTPQKKKNPFPKNPNAPPDLSDPGEPDMDDETGTGEDPGAGGPVPPVPAKGPAPAAPPQAPGQDQGQEPGQGGGDEEANQAAHGYLDELLSDQTARQPVGALLELICTLMKGKSGPDQGAAAGADDGSDPNVTI